MEYSPYIGSNVQNLSGGGNTYGSIKGTVKKQGRVYRSVVYLFSPIHNQILMTQTNDLGEYTFKGLPKGYKYAVFARDSAQEFNAVIQDNVVPK